MRLLCTEFRRRILPALLAGVMSFSGVVGALTPIAAVAKDKDDKWAEKRIKDRGRVAADLDDELKQPKLKKQRWSKDKGGVQMLQLLVKSDASDDQLNDLRGEVEQLGGQVLVLHSRFKTLTVELPANKVKKLAKHPDVSAITPNRETQGAASTVEMIVGANASGVRNYSSATSYSGYDGSGVGIAILDSGVMKAHKNFLNAAGASRVKRSVDMLKGTLANWSEAWSGNSSPKPGSSELASYEAAIAADSATTQDGYGHGTHVASVAAGRGFYQAPDSTGVAPQRQYL